MSTLVCLRFASRAFFFSSYLYFPKSRSLQTGGSALGFTSTRSRPCSCAILRASSVVITPNIPPSAPTTRTSWTRIRWLMRICGTGFGGVVGLLPAHRDERHLLGGQPHRERPRDVLDVHPEEALERSQDGPVKHHRPVRVAVFSNEFELEAVGERVIDLDGPELP